MAVRGKTVTLLVYEYGAAITKASDLEAFKTTLWIDFSSAGIQVFKLLRWWGGCEQTA
ncbi:hypothetical protein L917_01240 [Phytophthora nicotianae]|uniref:Uncharacterized protein n=1 Tax=Phytophthora nicotianae TaxID=4792 RepID=W2M018_PHYNI|nr:hypothetical protein L917_01240 [Phytophthora nicotianae]